MDATRFDTIAKLFATKRLSRRAALAQGSAGIAAAGLAATGLSAARAQDATPPAGEGDEKTMFLFLQAFQSGSIAPKEAAEGRYTLTLAHGLGQTIYFSDRPERLVGASPTPQFLDGLGFPEDNPPNAALVVETESGQTEIAVVELFSPAYDEATHTATYEVAVLAEWESELGVGLTETPTDLAGFSPAFGAAHLFIDDCPDPAQIYCTYKGDFMLIASAPGCYDVNNYCCGICDRDDQHWIDQCNTNARTRDFCSGGCGVGYEWCGN